MRHSDSDSQSEGSEARSEREEAHMKRLVYMAKQQQSLMSAWFAASSGRDITNVLPPMRPRSSYSLKRTSSGPVDVDNVDASSQQTMRRQKSKPVDVDTLSEQSVASNRSAGSSSSSKSFFQRVFPVSSDTASAASDGGKTLKISNVTDVESGIPVDENDEIAGWPLRQRLIAASLFCILIAVALTVVVSLIITGVDDGNAGDSTLFGDTLEGRGSGFPTAAPTFENISIEVSSSNIPSQVPSRSPSLAPSSRPTSIPSSFPTLSPSGSPTSEPSAGPTISPTKSPAPSASPTLSPTTTFSTSDFDTLISLSGEQILEQYGHTVAVSGDGTVVAVGAPNYSDSDKLSKSGRVQVFERLARQWRLRGQTLYGRNELDQFGYAVSLSEDGSRLAVSEPGLDGPAGDRAGNVRVFDYDGAATWILTGNEIGGEAVADLFGLSLSLSGDGKRFAVGSPYHDGDETINLSGRVRVFEYKDKSWKNVGDPLDGPQSLDWFGWAVSLSFDGTAVAVGAPRNTQHGGFVRCYEWDKGSWNQAGADIINTVGDSIQLDDRFGMTVSMSPDGKRVAIGSPWKDQGTNTRRSGLVAVYQLVRNEWTLLGDSLSGSNTNDRFGWSLQLSGDTLAIGIPGQNKVSIHRWTGSYWDTVSTPLQAEQQRDEYGHSVAISTDGSIVVVGATESSQAGTGYATVSQQVQV